MMMKQLFSVLLITVFLFGCKTDEKEVYTQSIKDQSFAEVITMDVIEEVLTITPTYVINGEYVSDTNIIITSTPIISSPSYPKTISIDYGNGIVGPDGKTRKGIIKVLINSGTVLTENLKINFDDYIAEGNTVYGSLTATYANSNNTLSYNVSISGTGLTFVSANGTMKWSGDFLITRASGESSPNIKDDIFKLSGSTTGVDFSGTSYVVSTETDHTIDFNCNNIITGGTSKIIPNGKGVHDVDYGSGNCDANGVISLSSGNSKNFNF
jgi:hypothetical protein